MRRTTSPEEMRAIIEHPAVRPWTWDRKEAPPVPIGEDIYHLVSDDGFVSFFPVDGAWDAHIGVLPPHGKGRGALILNEALSWMFENTECRKVVAQPFAFNERAIRVFEKCGFKRGGDAQKFKWNGVARDRVLMEKGSEQCLG